MTRIAVCMIVLTALAVAGCGSSVATPRTTPSANPTLSASTPEVSPTAGTGAPAVDPSDFVPGVDNPWFPLVPGTRLTYTGTKDGEPAVDVFEITGETKLIDGVTCLVIRDTLTLSGKLHEKTEDWFAQDRVGNVWYFGEATAVYDEQGQVTSTEGSWQAGLDGARPGIYMPGDPQVGQSFQQEFYAGHAEDHFVVLLLSTSVKVPYGSFTDALLTAEWTPLEPDVLSEKTYVKGIGQVTERDITGGQEGMQLLDVQRP